MNVRALEQDVRQAHERRPLVDRLDDPARLHTNPVIARDHDDLRPDLGVTHDTLAAYTRRLYLLPEINDTVDFFHIKHHYYESHRGINPTGIVPLGPTMDFLAL